MIEKYLNNRLLTLFVIPTILGSLTVFSFEPFNFTIINFLVFPIFFYLLIYIKRKSKGIYRKKPYRINLFLFGTCFGFGFYLSGIHWIVNSLTFDENFKILIPFGLILIPLFLSIFFSVTTVLAGPFLNLNVASIFLISASLAFSDYIRAKILTGFPWNLWAYSFSWNTEIIQILHKSGLFTFNLLLITLFVFPSVLFFNLSYSKKIFSIICILLTFLILYIYGSHSINQNKIFLNNFDKKFNIKVVSPNFDLEYGLKIKEIENRLKKLIKFSSPDKKIKTLFVWPEGVFSGYSFNEILKLKNTFKNNFGENHLILFGINRLDEKSGNYYNSMILVNNKFEIIQEYNKLKLVPFGEFLPFEKTLEKFGLKKITEGYGSFLKGESQNNLIFKELNILPLICYEIIFTNLIQNSSENSNLIVNISEDGWFGNSIGPHQHFTKSKFRAIENNTYLIRSANRGISAIINNKGEVIKRINPSEAANIELEVPLIKSKNKSKNDLIFFILLITYIFIFNYYKKNNAK